MFKMFGRIINSKGLLYNKTAFNFSKRLRHKIQNQFKKQEIPETPEQIQERQITKKYPKVKPQSIAQKLNHSLVMQFAPLAAILLNCITFSEDPLSNAYTYPLFIAEKFLTLLMLTNVPFSSESIKKYAAVAAIVLPAFIPISSVYSLATQIIQIFVFLVHQKLNQKQSSHILTEEEKILLTERIKVKLALYLSLSTVFIIKMFYFYECIQMEIRIKQLNEKNLQENGQQPIPKFVPN